MKKRKDDWLYKKQAWRRLSKANLKKNPLCVMCLAEKRLVRARVSDHITPWKTQSEFFAGPLQSLCFQCHNIKTKVYDLPEQIRRKKTEIRFINE